MLYVSIAKLELQRELQLLSHGGEAFHLNSAHVRYGTTYAAGTLCFPLPARIDPKTRQHKCPIHCAANSCPELGSR